MLFRILEKMDSNTIITTWIAPVVTGVIVVVITTGIGKIVSIWWKNRTFLKNRDRANEKYIDNVLPYMIQRISVDVDFVISVKKAISVQFNLQEKHLYTNEQLKNQIILSISDSKFMPELQKSELIQHVQSTFKNIGNDAEKVEDLRKEERKISKKYPMIMLIISVCFTMIVYMVNPEKVDDPNSIAQLLAVMGIIFSLGSASSLWMILLSESTNKINIEIAHSGIIGATYTVVQALVSTISEILYGKKKNTDD